MTGGAGQTGKIRGIGEFLGGATASGWVGVQRVLLLLLFCVLHFRFFATSFLPENSDFGWPLLAAGAVFLLLGLVRPLEGMLMALLAMPFLNLSYMGGVWGHPAVAMLPLGAVYFGWAVRWAAQGLLGRYRKPLLWVEILLDALLWAGLVRFATSVVSPSFANGVWMFFTAPTGRFIDEFQWIQVGYFWLCFLGTAQMLLSERAHARGRKLLEGTLYGLFGLILVAVVIDWFLGWPAFQGPYLTSPFLGLHELAAVMLGYFGFLTARYLRGGGAGGWLHGVLAVLSATVVFATTSRTAFLALAGLLVVLVLIFVRSWRDGFRLGLLTGALVLGFVFAAVFPAGTKILVSDQRQEELANIQDWKENHTVVYRLQIWQRALLLLTERPWDGIGFAKLSTTRTQATASLYDSGHEEIKVWDGHNLLLNIALYQGIGTGVLFFLFLSCWAWAVGSGIDIRKGVVEPSLLAVAIFLLVNMTNSAAAWPLAMQIFACWLCLPWFREKAEREGGVGSRVPAWGVAVVFLPAALLVLLIPWTISADRAMQTEARGYGHFNGIYLFDAERFQTLGEVGLVVPKGSGVAVLEIRQNPYLGPLPGWPVEVLLRGKEGNERLLTGLISGETHLKVPLEGVEVVLVRAPTPFDRLPLRGWFQPAVLVMGLENAQGEAVHPTDFFFHPSLRPAGH